MTELLKIGYFFDDSRRFPWDLFFTGIPKVGPVHSYLCTILASFAEDGYKEFMRGLPSLSELRRAARASPGVMAEICSYCDSLEALEGRDRSSVAQEVLDFLAGHRGFRQHAQKTLDRLWRQGLISVPEEVEPSDKP